MSEPNKIHEYYPEIYPRKLWVAVGVPYVVIKDMFENVEPWDGHTDKDVLKRLNELNLYRPTAFPAE
jgi:hypothetical protein